MDQPLRLEDESPLDRRRHRGHQRGRARLSCPARRRATNAPLAKPIGRSCNGACPATCFCTRPPARGVCLQRPPSLRSLGEFRYRRRSSCCMGCPLWPARATSSRGSITPPTWSITRKILNASATTSWKMLYIFRNLPMRLRWNSSSGRASSDLRSDQVVLEFSRDIIHKLVCPKCGQEEQCFVPVGAIGYDGGRCLRGRSNASGAHPVRVSRRTRSLPGIGSTN